MMNKLRVVYGKSKDAMFDQFDQSQSRPFRIPQRSNRNILPFLSSILSLIPRSPRIKQLHPRRSVHWLQRTHLAELTLHSSLISQTFLISTPSHRTTLSSSPPSSPRSSSTAAGNSSPFAAASILSASP